LDKMPHAVWKGSISFGLVTIPVSLYPATERDELAFHLLDANDLSPIHQVRTNAAGEAVPWEAVVRGYEYEEGRFVTLTDDELRAANVKATQTIDIAEFVKASDIDPIYYDAPYFLEPARAGRKAYALLRDTMVSTGYVGVGRMVIRTRQHVCVVRPYGDLLLAELLRYSYEIRDVDAYDVPHADSPDAAVSEQEIAMAGQLVGSMVAEWEPSTFHDAYREDVLDLIAKKVEGGVTHQAIATAAPQPEPGEGEVVDIMDLLKRSLAEKKTGGGVPPKRKRA
jgi:DNA end-binding protein Ku